MFDVQSICQRADMQATGTAKATQQKVSRVVALFYGYTMQGLRHLLFSDGDDALCHFDHRHGLGLSQWQNGLFSLIPMQPHIATQKGAFLQMTQN